MKQLQAYKFEIRPNGAQQRDMRRFAGSCRFVYNKALALQKAHYEAGGKFIGYVDMAKHLTGWRREAEISWLSLAPIHPLQHALKDLDRAYQNFFAQRADFPRFKRKGSGGSFRFPDKKQFKLDQVNSRIFLPKLGWMRYRNSRTVLGTVKNITVSCIGGRWFMSVQAEREIDQPAHPSTAATGVDVGIARFATLSDGSFIEPVSSFKKHEKRLARYQRAMGRKVKFSKNWRKARDKVTRLHTRIGNVRRDFLHKTSTILSKNHALIAVEDLQVKNMSRSAAGSVDLPGKNVSQKAGLNRSILDQGWGEFRRQLEYKQLWRGGWLIAVPPQNTSRTCPACGHISADNRKTQAKFACVECGYENHADTVGAINILERGHRLLACGELAQSGRSVKQEPVEATDQGIALV